MGGRPFFKFIKKFLYYKICVLMDCSCVQTLDQDGRIKLNGNVCVMSLTQIGSPSATVLRLVGTGECRVEIEMDCIYW